MPALCTKNQKREQRVADEGIGPATRNGGVFDRAENCPRKENSGRATVEERGGNFGGTKKSRGSVGETIAGETGSTAATRGRDGAERTVVARERGTIGPEGRGALAAALSYSGLLGGTN